VNRPAANYHGVVPVTVIIRDLPLFYDVAGKVVYYGGECAKYMSEFQFAYARG